MKHSLYLLPCLVGASTGLAQDTSPRSPSQLDAPSAVAKVNSADKDLGAPLGPPLYQPFRWGPVDFRPHLNYTITYGDGIQSGPGTERKTVIQTISPGVTLQFGSRWSLDYTPRYSIYSHDDFDDTLAHNVSLQGGAKWHEWNFGISQVYAVSSDPLIETGRQTEQESFSTGLSASRPIGSKLLLQLTASQNLRFSEGFNDSKSWSTMEWLNYQVAPKLSVAGGLGFGYDDVSLGSDMYNEQVRARVDARIAQKLNLSVNGGVEFRQFATGGAGSLVNPLYGASITYRPFDYTTLTLSGDRTVSPSLFSDQISESTDISLALNQRLLGMLFLTVSAGYGMGDYVSTLQTTATTRSDEHTQFGASLSYSFWKRASASIFYNHSRNSSDSDAFSYTSSQVGLNLGYRF